MKRSSPLLLGFLLLGAAVATAQAVVIQSADCVGWSGWNPPGTLPGTATGGEWPDGHPPPGCVVSHSHIPLGPATVESYLFFSAGAYTPSSAGAIATLDFGVDERLQYSAADLGVRLQLALRQDGNVYVPFVGTAAPGASWSRFTASGLGRNDFDDPYRAGVQAPNFGGGAIEFGLLVRSTSTGGLIGSMILELDNFASTSRTRSARRTSPSTPPASSPIRPVPGTSSCRSRYPLVPTTWTGIETSS